MVSVRRLRKIPFWKTSKTRHGWELHIKLHCNHADRATLDFMKRVQGVGCHKYRIVPPKEKKALV